LFVDLNIDAVIYRLSIFKFNWYVGLLGLWGFCTFCGSTCGSTLCLCLWISTLIHVLYYCIKQIELVLDIRIIKAVDILL